MIMDEDTVSYAIYPGSSSLPLDELARRCTMAVLSQASKFIWHRERFALWPDRDGKCLRGSTCYGESVEDEWFVVALLREVTSLVEGTVARVEDTDGELLLIEAADHLPQWAQEPENARGRVFLHGGQVHLVPLADRPSTLSPFPGKIPESTDSSALAEIVADESFLTTASEPVQDAIKQRIGSMPGDWTSNLHYVHLQLPLKAAQVLHQSPQLVSAAINRIMVTDRSDMRLLQQMEAFPADETILTGIEMTKCLYAMMESKTLWPSKRATFWSERHQPGSKEYCDAVRGFKIAAGMELLWHDSQKIEGECTKVEKKYLESLKSLGYFGELLEGSQEHTALLRSARAYFASSDGEVGRGKYNANAVEFMECFRSAENIAEEECASRCDKLKRPPDSDCWMEHSQESLDEMLRRHFRLAEGDEPAMKKKLESFLAAESDMNGVEEEDLDKPVELDVTNFVDSMKKLLGGANGDLDAEEDTDSDMDERLEAELLDSNVKEGTELSMAMKSLYEEMKEMPSGPAKTLLKSVKKS